MSIRFENTEVVGWEAAIRGMRNPMNSWAKSDSDIVDFDENCGVCKSCLKIDHCGGDGLIGPNDLDLMKRLRNAGTDHRKFMRMITVYVDITAPLYWWKEFDTYKVGTVANSCSTMHKIHEKEFTLEDFSCEHLDDSVGCYNVSTGDSFLDYDFTSEDVLKVIIASLNFWRNKYLIACKTESETGLPAKDIWWQMIQLLPSSYNQKRTVMLNYEVLANIYKSRKGHKLNEWSEHKESTCTVDTHRVCKNPKEFLLCEYCNVGKGFCDWIKTLPYSELITGDFVEREK